MSQIDAKKIARYRELRGNKERLELQGKDVPAKIIDEMAWIKSQCTEEERQELNQLQEPASF